MKRRVTSGAVGAALLWALLLLVAPGVGSAQVRDDPPLMVESFACRGNDTTTCEFILSHVYLSVGRPVDEREIREATLRLSWLKIFEGVSIYLEKGTQRGLATVVIEVREASPFAYDVTLGLVSQAGSAGPVMAGGVSHYNLFGAGKILNAHVEALLHTDGPVARGTGANVGYVDPHLFGTKRNFGTATVWYEEVHREWKNGDLVDAETLAIDVAYGRRLWSFSYLTVGYRYRPVSDIYIRRRQRDGMFEERTAINHGGALLGYGWNSEDDPYFPTQGSRLHFGLVQSYDGRDDYSFSFSKNWRPFGEGVWTLGLDASAALSVQYSRLLPTTGVFRGMRRARWYVTPFIRPMGTSEEGDRITEVGMNAGVQLETRSFGIVNFYVFGSGVSTARDR